MIPIESHCCGNYVFEEVGNGVWRAQELPCMIHSCPEDCQAWMEIVNGTYQQPKRRRRSRNATAATKKKMEMVAEMTVETTEPQHTHTDVCEIEHAAMDTTHCCHYEHHESIRKSFQRRSRRVNFMLLPLTSLRNLVAVGGRRRKQSSELTDEKEKPTTATAARIEDEIRTQATDIEDRESLFAFQHHISRTSNNTVRIVGGDSVNTGRNVSNGRRNKKARKHRLAEI